jgi:hypothetical protein
MLDSEKMWIRRQPPVFARMPSMRPHSINPRPPGMAESPVPPAAAGAAQLAAAKVPKAMPQPSAPLAAAPSAEDDAEASERDGGFHESSYELQHGLQISESEWPDDVTVPGALGER